MISYFTQELIEGEELRKVIRKHWVILAPCFLKAVFIIALAFILGDFLSSYKLGAIVFFVLFLSGLVYASYKYLVWYLDCFIITDQRIIDIHQKGLFNRVVAEVKFANIGDAVYQIKGMAATIFNFGEIKIQLSDGSGAIVMEQIKNPQKVREMIINLKPNLV